MKKIVVLVVCLMLTGSVASASPLMDFAAGKGSIDLTMRDAKNSMGDTDFDKKYNLDAALTLGLGGKWGFQFRNFQPQSADTYFGIPVNVNVKLETNEFNVLYKLDKNVAAFAGYVTAKGTEEFVGVFSASSDRKNMWQVGVVATAPLGDKTTFWASAAAGNDLINWEVGIGYAFSPNCEFNVNYRELKVDDLSGVDMKSKGLGFGLTFKF